MFSKWVLKKSLTAWNCPMILHFQNITENKRRSRSREKTSEDNVYVWMGGHRSRYIDISYRLSSISVSSWKNKTHCNSSFLSSISKSCIRNFPKKSTRITWLNLRVFRKLLSQLSHYFTFHCVEKIFKNCFCKGKMSSHNSFPSMPFSISFNLSPKFLCFFFLLNTLSTALKILNNLSTFSAFQTLHHTSFVTSKLEFAKSIFRGYNV